MKLIAKQTVNLGTRSVAPGEEFDVESDKDAKELIELGAAERKTRTVADDGDDEADRDAAPTTATGRSTDTPASGQTHAPDPNAVAAASRSARR